ncbi:hypothetical protein PV328_001091 [Microctonus aethiopoides]|uniref:Uncharacterized protein n=1 Tax=Microctonus aethiopoides TaxID=144406 RepID=A0AA39KX95_9HYME|nr:hypothetical protein PV328_001091 [Microctonus aethiopoides]
MCIRPIMLYACPVWCCTSNSNIKNLQVVQNRCFNIINYGYYRLNPSYMKIDELHEKVKIDFIEQVIDKLAKKFYKPQVNNIHILKNYGENAINELWDKKD